MADPLHSMKRKLDVPNAFLRRVAVSALFAKAATDKKISTDSHREAILLCLAHSSQVVVEEGVSQLSSAPGITRQNAIALILAALPAASGLLEFWWLQIEAGDALPKPPSPFTEEHILVAAILLQPAVQSVLLHSLFASMLDASTNSQNSVNAVKQVWESAKNFFEWGLTWRKEASLESLDRANNYLVLRTEILDVMIKLSCNIVEWRGILMPLMVRYVGLIPLVSPAACSFAASTISSIAEVVEAELEEPSLNEEQFQLLITKLITFSLQYCHGALLRGMGIEGTISSIRHIARIAHEDGFAEAIAPFLPLLGFLCMRSTGHTRHMILGTICEAVKGKYLEKRCGPPPYLPGLLLLPALQATTLRSSKIDQKWGPHLVDLISRMLAGPMQEEQANLSLQHTSCGLVFTGELGLLEQGTRILCKLWWRIGEKGDLLRWLKSLGTSFKGAFRKKKEAEKQPFSADDSHADDDLCDSSSVFSLVLCSLLTHSNPEALQSVAEVLEEFLVLIPTEAPSFLPVVLFQLQRLGSSPSMGSAAAELSLLQSLRSMCGHQHVLPWVLRTLQTLMEEGSPELVRCASLRTLCSCWLQYGVGWKHIQGILGGLIQSKSESDKMLQVTLAACLRDVCRRESAAGLEIIAGIQQCMLDTDPCVNALGLTCINMMCEQDVLDFYKAWKIVQRWHPKIPSEDIIACEWVQLIGYGALDAHVNPDKVEAILSILWSATKHPNPETRKKVYESLASYSPEILEPLEQLSPLIDYVQLLLTERDSQARLSAEGAVMVALDYEHARRRRFMTGKTTQRQQTGPRSAKNNISNQLSVVLPAKVCSGLEGDEQGLVTSGSVPFMSGPLPGALLICYSPKASITGEALGPKYREVFLSLCDSLAWSGWTHPYMALSAWKEFIIRWLGAISSVPDPIWEAIHQVWSRGLAPSAGNSLLAAGALCMTGKMSEAHLKWLLQESKSQLHFGSSSTVICCAAHVLSVCGSGLHPADWGGRLDIASQLKAAMGSTESGIVMSGCAEALGMIAMGIVHDEFLLKRPETSAFLGDSMSFLVSCLVGLCPDTEYLQSKIFSSWPDTWSPLEASENIWEGHMFQDLGTALAGVCGAISIVGCAVLKAGNIEFPIELASEMVAFLERISIADGLLIGAFKGLVHLIPCLSRFQADCDAILEASLEAAWNLADNSTLSQGVRAWAAFSVGAFCAALLDRDDDVKSGPKRVPTYARHLVRLVETATGETETCCGGLMGLGAMIGGVTLPCRELDEAGPSNISINLLTSPAKNLISHAAEAVGTLTSEFIDPRASALGTWISIAAGHSYRKALSSTPSSTGAASALASYPTDGAMRPLVEQCLGLLESVSNATGTVMSVSASTAPGTKSSTQGSQVAVSTPPVLTFPFANQMGVLVSVVRCIRQAKRVPLLHWGSVCHQILEVCCVGGEGCEELEVEAIGLCLTHARTPSLGLKEVLEGLVMPHAFVQLSQSAKKSILERLASVVAALPAAHVPRILKQLPSMVRSGVGKQSTISLELLISGWEGLEAAIHWGPEIGKKSAEVSNSLITAAGDLLQVIPIPNQVYPGDLYGVRNKLAGSASDRIDTQDYTFDDPNVWRAWRTATSCFKALKEPEVLQLTKMEGSPDICIRSMLMRTLLVWTGGLTTRDLAPCRYFCMDHDIHNSHMILSLAYLDAPTTLQHQLLTEILEVMKECKKPLVAFDLVRKLAAVWYSGSSQNSPGNMHISLCDSLPENHHFPSIFANLLTASSMAPYIQPIVGILCMLLDSAEENINMVEWQEIRTTVCECLRAIRHKIDDDVLLLISRQWEW